jgi:endonuclease III
MASPRIGPSSPPERRARVVVRRLRALYPGATTSLDYVNAWQLLVSVILSAQTTDARVNEVTPRLFAELPTPEAVLQATQAELEDLIRPTGFYRNKSRSLRGAAEYLIEHHDGKVPRTTGELVKVPGVGRKTAAVVLGEAYGIAEGIAVDTHAGRLSRRLGLTSETDPIRAERDLMAVVPRSAWIAWTHLLIAHGRAVCRSRVPQCTACVLNDICPEGAERLRVLRRIPQRRRA